MPAIKDILAQKGSQVLTIGPEATVLDGAMLMNEHKIGGLVVVEDRRVIGMFTERDILRRVVAEQRDPATVKVGDVMSTGVTVCKLNCTIDEARGLMKHRRVRHLPVVDCETALNLIGMISIGDLNAFSLNEEKKANHFLQEYLYGRA